MRNLINYDAFSSCWWTRRQALRHLFSIRYDKRVNIDNVPLGKGHGGRRNRARWCASPNTTKTRYSPRTRYPLRTGVP